jgi:NAD(P)-dependent dehydrogenase (short-subunit alcohol dehydrogenase family)
MRYPLAGHAGARALRPLILIASLEQNVAKTIVITGAGVGLGRELARRFARDGETVILLGRTLSKVQAVADDIGGTAFAVECDVTSPDSVRAAFAAVAARHSKIDVLINNAAIYEPFMIAEASDAQILNPLLTNFAGPIFCARAAIPMMAAGGHIINVSSESVTITFPMLSLYQSSKAGLERFSESLARELEEPGIRVTTVRAGPMYEEGKTSNWEPEAAMRFGMACREAGLDLMTRPVTHFKSVTDVFRAVIDLAPDIQLSTVVIESRRGGPVVAEILNKES